MFIFFNCFLKAILFIFNFKSSVEFYAVEYCRVYFDVYFMKIICTQNRCITIIKKNNDNANNIQQKLI